MIDLTPSQSAANDALCYMTIPNTNVALLDNEIAIEFAHLHNLPIIVRNDADTNAMIRACIAQNIDVMFDDADDATRAVYAIFADYEKNDLLEDRREYDADDLSRANSELDVLQIGLLRALIENEFRV